MEEILIRLAAAAQARRDAAAKVVEAEEEFQAALKAYAQFKADDENSDSADTSV